MQMVSHQAISLISSVPLWPLDLDIVPLSSKSVWGNEIDSTLRQQNKRRNSLSDRPHEIIDFQIQNLCSNRNIFRWGHTAAYISIHNRLCNISITTDITTPVGWDNSPNAWRWVGTRQQQSSVRYTATQLKSCDLLQKLAC